MRRRAASPRTYARIAGVLIVVSIVAGGFGEVFIPVHFTAAGDATAIANSVRSSEFLYRLGFGAYLVEALCDVSLTMLLYVLLRPVRSDIAMLAAFLRLVATAVFAGAELFYFAALVIARGADQLTGFSPERVDALALLSLKVYGAGAGIFNSLYGVPSILIGYLIHRSGFLPPALGILWIIGGIGFVAADVAVVLAPGLPFTIFVAPQGLAALLLALWFLVRGVDVAKWDESATSAG